MVLVCLAVLFVAFLFSSAPSVEDFKPYVESRLKKVLHTESVHLSHLRLAWQAGPVIDLGKVDIQTASFSLQQASVQLAYPIYYPFVGRFAPEVVVEHGDVSINLDAKSEQHTAMPDIQLSLRHVALHWAYRYERQTLRDVSLYVQPHGRNTLLQAPGVHAQLVFGRDGVLRLADVTIEDFSGFPQTWLRYVQGVSKAHVLVQKQGKHTWQWQANMQAKQGLVQVEQVHLRIPFSQFYGQGDIRLASGESLALERFSATTLRWRSDEGFADASMRWQDGKLVLEVADGATDMRNLWSWLWMLDEGEDWHAWLSAMHQGKATHAKGSLSLPWATPLASGLDTAMFSQLEFQVTAKAQGADIALGIAGDYLYGVDAEVEVDERGLRATIHHADLNHGVAQVHGDYHIAWDSLLMTIDAQGMGDVGKLHTWLDPESAADLHWGKAPAKAKVHMQWYANQTEPTVTTVALQPYQPWHLQLAGIDAVVQQGMATWDYQKGLSLTDMQVETPWFSGKLALFLDKQQDWALDSLSFTGQSSLATLTDDFMLPIVKPQGYAGIKLMFAKHQWHGVIDLSQNTWQDFIGFHKPKHDRLRITLAGTSGKKTFPIRFHQMRVQHPGFAVRGGLVINQDKLDFDFQRIQTAQVDGRMRLLMPLDTNQAWGIEAESTYLDHRILHPYLDDISLDQPDTPSSTRPWHIFAKADTLRWDKSVLRGVKLKLASDQQMTGEFEASSAHIGASHFKRIQASFTVQAHGKLDVHQLKAEGADQSIVVSGTVMPQRDGVLQWQGLALMSGKFGTLMKQAELDKLFQEGDMHSLFIGKGAFKQGEPWWREVQGSLRLRIDDGRLMEGGTLTHLLAAISLVDLPKYLIFDRGDVVGKGLFYDKLQLEAAIDGHVLNIRQLSLQSSALAAGGRGKVSLDSGDLDIVLVVRPWQNAEVLIGYIPLLGDILTGEDKSILRKVYRIHGPASDAQVDEVDPEEVGLPKAGYLEDLFSPDKWFKTKDKSKDKVQ